MKNGAMLLVPLIALCLATRTADALDLSVPVGGDIQDAIDKVSSADGGSVNLAAGVHRIDTPIRMRSNVTLSGKGSAATTIKTSKIIKSIRQASEGLKNVTIQDLSITGVAVNGSHAILLVSYRKEHKNIKLLRVHASHTGWGVHIKGADGVTITSCAFTRNGAKGKEGYAHNLYLRRCKNALVSKTKLNGSPSGNGCNISYSKNVTIDNCEVLDNHFRGIRAADTDGYTVKNSIIGRNGDVGLLANREKVSTRNINFVNNVVFDNGKGGIQARRGVTGSVTNCRSFNNNTFNIDLNSNITQSGNSTKSVAAGQLPGAASKGNRATPHPKSPEFSWARIPLYMHIRKATSYTDKEIAFMAKFPLITFEKANGSKDHGSVEKGTLIAARAVKKVNPKAKILYYRNVIVHYGGYEANKGLKPISGALLKDGKGNTKLVRNRVEAYDLSNSDLRAWWVKTCRTMTADPAIDGVFLDGNIKALEPGYLTRQVGAAKKKQTMDGYRLMMKQTREAIGPNELMIANILRARFENAGLEYMGYFDGSYLEGFFHNVGKATYEEHVAKGIDAMQKAASQGKIIAFTAGLALPKNTSNMGIDEGHTTVKSNEQARAALTYPLALFLICAEKYSYFRVHEGYSADGNNRWMRWFPEYDRPLGPPNGPATKDGFRYSRTFEHASVDLDIKKRTATIRW